MDDAIAMVTQPDTTQQTSTNAPTPTPPPSNHREILPPANTNPPPVNHNEVPPATTTTTTASAVRRPVPRPKPGKGTTQPSLRLVPSGNFFLALNRSHHFLLKKVRI